MILNTATSRQIIIPGGNILSSRNPTVSVLSQSHPCNGLGGEDCQCGGSCFATNELGQTLTNENHSHSYAEVIFSREDSSWIQDKTQVRKLSNGDVEVQISSNRDDQNLNLFFQKNNYRGGWSFYNKYNNTVHQIPSNSSLYDFAVASSIAHQIFIVNKHKLLAENNLGAQAPQGDDAGSKKYCVDHNLVCDVVGNTLLLPVLFCVIRVNILDCCIKHDLDLWCGIKSSNTEEIISRYAEINQDVASCIADKIFNTLKNDTPWYCGGSITGSIFGVAWAVVGAILGYIGTLIMSPKGDKLFPKDGRNDGSCLCKGTGSTYQCYGEGQPYNTCENLCKKFNRPETCYDCKKKCVYKDGRLVEVQRDFGPTGNSENCCVDTTEKCLGDCPTCEGCEWVCVTGPSGKRERKLLNFNKTKANLPCCEIPPMPTRPCSDTASGVSFV